MDVIMMTLLHEHQATLTYMSRVQDLSTDTKLGVVTFLIPVYLA